MAGKGRRCSHGKLGVQSPDDSGLDNAAHCFVSAGGIRLFAKDEHGRSGSGVQSCATYPMSKARPSSVDSSASNREAIRSRSARQVRGPPGLSTRSSLSKTCSQNMDRRIGIIGPRDAYVLAALLCVQFSTRTNADESVRASGDANRRLHGSWSEWREASKRAVPT